MKRYMVRGGHTIYEMYEVSVEANNEEEAVSKADKIPLEEWYDLQKTGNDFAIEDVWEDDDE